MSVNETQVGGTHYKTSYEHWDLIINTGSDYLVGNATRYIVRWRKKNGVEDLQKAAHYIDKLLTVLNRFYDGREGARARNIECVERFLEANDLPIFEQLAVTKLICWERVEDLLFARGVISDLLVEAGARSVPLEDSNKHAERE